MTTDRAGRLVLHFAFHILMIFAQASNQLQEFFRIVYCSDHWENLRQGFYEAFKFLLIQPLKHFIVFFRIILHHIHH